MNNHPWIQHNRQAWQQLAKHGHRLARPVALDDLSNPLPRIDPLGWLGPSIRGWRVLCLAAGGGKHGPLYAAAGAEVTVFDLSAAMLELDRQARIELGIQFRIVEGSMDDLSALVDGEFDLVIHPVSTCYLPDPLPVFREVARVTRPGGLYISQHKTPQSLQTSLQTDRNHYVVDRPYYATEPVPPASQANLVREPGTYEFIHTWETLIGGICRAGFFVEDLHEPRHADPAKPFGSFEHRSMYVAPYVRLKARRRHCDGATNVPQNHLLTLSE